MPQYIIATDSLETFVSDSLNFPTQLEIGFDPVDKNNVAYKKYQLNYALYRFLGGFNVRLPKSFVAQAGAVLITNVDNITTNSLTNSKTYTYTFTSTSTNNPVMQALVGMPDQKLLAPGILEIYGSCTDPSGQVVTVFRSTYLTQTPP